MLIIFNELTDTTCHEIIENESWSETASVIDCVSENQEMDSEAVSVEWGFAKKVIS